MTGTKKWGNTTSKKGEASRIFIANINPKLVDCEELEKLFEKYGKVQGIDINPNGFAFVQFETPEEAKKAAEGEEGTEVQGKVIEVKMFDKSSQFKGKGRGDRNRDRSRSPIGRGRGRNGRHPGDYPPSQFEHFPEHMQFKHFRPPFNNHPDMMNQYNYQFGNQMMPPPIMGPLDFNPNQAPPFCPPRPLPGANEVEIIVINRDQTEYAEMIKRRICSETSIKLVDTLFLHSVQRISMTLNDLYERRTFYAIVIGPMNETNKTCTLHILHNQTEHRNLPINEGLVLMQRDYCNFVGLKEGAPLNYPANANDNGNLVGGNSMPQPHQPSYSGPGVHDTSKSVGGVSSANYSLAPQASSAALSKLASSTSTASGSKGAPPTSSKLPEEVRYALRSTLEDNSAQFLSLSQFDLVINFYQREREKLTAYQNGTSVDFGQSTTQQLEPSKENLLENPQVKAALNSLFQMGAINTSALSKGPSDSNSPYGMNSSSQPVGVANQSSAASGSYQGQNQSDSSYMYDSNNYKNSMASQPGAGSYSNQYHEAPPSYLSTDPMAGPASSQMAGDHFASNASLRRMESPNRPYRPVRPSRFQ